MVSPSLLRAWAWGAWAILALASPLIPSASPRIGLALQGPSLVHPLGTSPVGADLAWATAVAILRSHRFAILATCIALALALPLGLIAARKNNSSMVPAVRAFAAILDAISPIVIVAVALVSMPGLGSGGTAVLLGVLGWTFLFASARSAAVDVLRSSHVYALRALGYQPLRILATFVVPELLWRLSPHAAALATIYVGTLGGVEFLGLGLRREQSLGYLVLDGLDRVNQAPHYFLVSLGALLVAVFVLAWASVNLGAAARRHQGVT